MPVARNEPLGNFAGLVAPIHTLEATSRSSPPPTINRSAMISYVPLTVSPLPPPPPPRWGVVGSTTGLGVGSALGVASPSAGGDVTPWTVSGPSLANVGVREAAFEEHEAARTARMATPTRRER